MNPSVKPMINCGGKGEGVLCCSGGQDRSVGLHENRRSRTSQHTPPFPPQSTPQPKRTPHVKSLPLPGPCGASSACPLRLTRRARAAMTRFVLRAVCVRV